MASKRHTGIGAIVREFFLDHQNQNITLPDLARRLGYPNHSCSAAVSRLVSSGTLPGLERVGWACWRYAPQTEAPAKAEDGTEGSELFERVAELKDGALLLQCERGKLYVARPFKSSL